MTKPERVSILMPIKNAAAFLPKCLDSILEQTYPNWELLAVNDHSDDDSIKILNTYQKKDSRIKFYENEGKGIIPALRLAFSKTSGHFITRMDADDVMAIDKIELLRKKLLEDSDIDVAVGKVEYFSEETLGQGYLRYAEWLNSLIDKGEYWKDVYRECVVPSPCWMMTKEKLNSIGEFQESRYPEDYDLCFRMYVQGMQLGGVGKILHHWRDYSNRSSRTLPEYLDPWFLDIKIHYFLLVEMSNGKDLVVWGTGKKGKYFVKSLLSKSLNLHWVSSNPRKQNKDIYGVVIEKPEMINTLSSMVLAVLVSNRREQDKIRDYLSINNWKEGEDFFFFA